LDRAFWALQVAIDALTHKAVKRERAQLLARDLQTAFKSPVHPSAPPGQLGAQLEKLLAVRCYRNTLSTAAQSVDQALSVRAWLIDKVPHHFSSAFRESIDADLVAIGLAASGDARARGAA